MATEFYTRLFVDIELDLQSLLALIAKISDGKTNMATVEFDFLR